MTKRHYPKKKKKFGSGGHLIDHFNMVQAIGDSTSIMVDDSIGNGGSAGTNTGGSGSTSSNSTDVPAPYSYAQIDSWNCLTLYNAIADAESTMSVLQLSPANYQAWSQMISYMKTVYNGACVIQDSVSTPIVKSVSDPATANPNEATTPAGKPAEILPNSDGIITSGDSLTTQPPKPYVPPLAPLLTSLFGGGGGGGGGAASGDEVQPTTKKPSKWWLFLIAAGAIGGGYYLLKKEG